MHQSALQNEKAKKHAFLTDMYNDEYFPTFLVDKCKDILVQLCYDIEQQQPKYVSALYLLAHAATEKINDLEEEFEDNDSEIETAARECIALNFAFIAKTYGFIGADVEEMLAPRNW